jgi:hypothetical protein
MAMGFSRADHVTAIGHDGRVFIIGGDDNGSALSADVAVFDPYAEKFSLVGGLGTGRIGHTATTLPDGTILVMGGLRSVSGSPVAERFDPATGRTRTMASQPAFSRMNHTATRLANGNVLIAGGTAFGNNSDLIRRTVEIYDPVGDSFTSLTAALNSARERHVALPLAGDRVLIYGGAFTDQYIAAEIYEVDASTFAIASSPDVSFCAGAQAAVLGAGEVVIAGGEQKDGTPMGNVLLSSPGGKGLISGDRLRIARANQPLSR